MKTSRQQGSGIDIAVCGTSDVGIARSNNEDAFRIVDLGPRGVLLVVCDGMGGESAGEIASALAVDVICTHVADAAPDAAPADVLRGALEHANELVTVAAEEPSLNGMGTTAVVVLVRGGEAITAEVGDSRAYVSRGGALAQITKDQTYVQVLVDQGLLAPASIKMSVAKNVVLQGIGRAPELVVAQRRLALRNGDRLLVCSDGLSSFVSDEEIRGVLVSTAAVDEACAKLVELANAHGGHDNITVIVADVAGALPAPASSESVADSVTTIRAYGLGGG